MQMLEDTSAFFTDFSTPALIGGVEVRVIFDQPYAAPFGEAVDTNSTVCVLPTGSASVVRGQQIVIGGVSYVVDRVEPDGTGMSRITVFEAS